MAASIANRSLVLPEGVPCYRGRRLVNGDKPIVNSHCEQALEVLVWPVTISLGPSEHWFVDRVSKLERIRPFQTRLVELFFDPRDEFFDAAFVWHQKRRVPLRHIGIQSGSYFCVSRGIRQRIGDDLAVFIEGSKHRPGGVNLALALCSNRSPKKGRSSAECQDDKPAARSTPEIHALSLLRALVIMPAANPPPPAGSTSRLVVPANLMLRLRAVAA
jgi:hypothetical protein